MSLDAVGPSLGIIGRAVPGSFEPGAADSSGFFGLSVAMKSSFPAQGLVVAMTGEWPSIEDRHEVLIGPDRAVGLDVPQVDVQSQQVEREIRLVLRLVLGVVLIGL